MTITHLELDIDDEEAEPIRGTVADAHGRRWDFVGWIGLSSLLSRILERRDDGD